MQATADDILLGVNIDHVATLRQARGTRYPDPVQAASIAETAGADAITIHLREDRRHIQERDVLLLKDVLLTRMNLEMAVEEGVMRIAERVRPEDCCLVPERRQELTTEGGLDVAGQEPRIREACQRLGAAGIRVSLFIDPEPAQVEAAARVQAPVIELHTGHFADAEDLATSTREFTRIAEAARQAEQAGLTVNAGHGLNFQNVVYISRLRQIRELNIGHAIIARAIMTGLTEAVREMRRLMREARR